jgi:hypothetical protein
VLFVLSSNCHLVVAPHRGEIDGVYVLCPVLSDEGAEKFMQPEVVHQGISHAEKRRLFRWKIFFRLLASVPSLIGAVFKNDLGQILDYTGADRVVDTLFLSPRCEFDDPGLYCVAGTVAILIAFVIPCILRYQSIRVCVKSAKAASGSIQQRSMSSDVSLMSGEKTRPAWAYWLFPSQGLNDLDKEQKKAIQTPYWSIWSNDIAQHCMAIMGVGVFLYVLISLIQG